jgi:hypothetical protein
MENQTPQNQTPQKRTDTTGFGKGFSKDTIDTKFH